MKRILFSCFYLLALASLSAQTGPIYLLFTRDCMDQLEYSYTYGTNMQLTYSVHPRAEEQFLLTAGQPALTAPSIPPGTLNCREFNINAAFVDAINKNIRPVYMVHQNAQGYTLVPLATASQITRYGAVFQFRTPRYAFAVDTNNLVYEQNLALPGTNAYLYFSGVKVHNCRNEYSFRRVPTQNNSERSDFDFIPGVGITTDRTGKSAAEAENNQMRLTKINGLALEDYITTLCPSGGGSTVSRWAGQAGYGPTSTTVPPMNQDKELESIKQNGGLPGVGNPVYGQPINCPEPMGPGYHIMQPRETLNAVARTYGVDVKSLVRWNNIKDPDKVQICQKIWLQTPPQTNKGSAPSPVQHSAKNQTTPTVIHQSNYWNQQQPQTQVQPMPYNYTPPQYNTNQYTAPPIVFMQQQPQTQTLQSTQYNYTPVQYNTNEYITPPVAVMNQPQTLHTVQKGETLSSIARWYGMSVGRLRILNVMPPSGNVTIRPGQRLVVSEYTPQMPGIQDPNYSGAYLSTPSGTYPAAQTPAQYNTPAVTYSSPYGEDDRFYETPVTGAVTQPNPNTNQQRFATTNPALLPPQNTTPNYKEYIVREGETLNSVAIKYKANVQEMAIVNNKEVNEVLIAGQRILVPVKVN